MCMSSTTNYPQVIYTSTPWHWIYILGSKWQCVKSDARKKESIFSYQAQGACLRPYKDLQSLHTIEDSALKNLDTCKQIGPMASSILFLCCMTSNDLYKTSCTSSNKTTILLNREVVSSRFFMCDSYVGSEVLDKKTSWPVFF